MHDSLAIAAAAVALSSSPARAEEEWYGHHVLAADVGGLAIVAGGLKADITPLWVGGLGVALLGGPIVHAAHDNGNRAAASLGLRVGGPLIGFTVGAIIGSAFEGGGGESAAGRGIDTIIFGGGAGAIVGFVAAAFIDILFVAREDDGAESAPRMFSIGGRF